MKDSIVEGLKKLGLTEYEAKAYAALVGLGEQLPGRYMRQARFPGPESTIY